MQVGVLNNLYNKRYSMEM